MRVELPDLIPMQPYYRECAWGGQRLRALFGKALPTGVDVGESFEFSALPGQESTVAGGPLSGRGLADLAAEFGPDLVGAAVWRRFEGGVPLLIKLIDACDDRVLPDCGETDEMAMCYDMRHDDEGSDDPRYYVGEYRTQRCH